MRYRIYNDPNNLIVNANSWSKIELDVTSLSTTVASLKPYTRYEVKLSAKTKMGEGPETWITLKTDEDGSLVPFYTKSSTFPLFCLINLCDELNTFANFCISN